MRAVVAVLEQAHAYQRAGAAVQVLDAAGQVNGATCEGLAAADGIDSAGAIRTADAEQFLALPSSRQTVWEVTPGLLDVLSASTPIISGSGVTGVGAWLSQDLADSLDAQPQDGLKTANSPAAVPVSGVYEWPDDGRDRVLGYSVLAPVPAAGTFDRCMAVIWPPDETTTGLLYTALDGSSDQVEQYQLNSTLGDNIDAPRLLEDRLTRPAPMVAAAAGLLVGYAAVRWRRLELAAALHARVSKPDLAWSQSLQSVVCSLAAALVLAAVTAWTAQIGNPDPGLETWYIGLRTVAAGTITPIIGALVGVLATKERHLFRYFKER
ncbi:hypothetical protein [Promicromonospora sukumoe]|uniref:hypothetical protein n=1 Tax=Promicromonospora sukumoe TaxID=88382 RepID=UPI00365E59CE